MKLKLSQAMEFANDEKGTAAIEFAFVGLFVVTTTIMMIEILLVLFLSILLEGGVREAARYGVTGTDPSGNGREVQILQIIDNHTLGFLNMQDVTVSTMIYPDFASIGQAEDYTDENGNGEYDEGEAFVDANANSQWDTDRGVPGVGGPDDIVLYKVDVPWRFLTGLPRVLIGEEIPLGASIPVRNEPFVVQDDGGGVL